MRKNKTIKKQTAAAKMKEEFRMTPEWWAMRKELIAEQKIDPITKSKLTPRANCHHLDQRDCNYQSTDKSRYVMLNPKTHKFVHFIFIVYKKYGVQALVELRKILDKMIEMSND